MWEEGGEMKFEDHVREFLDNSIDDAEARQLAVVAVAESLRQLKLGIAERLWQARQLGPDDAGSSSAALGAARALKVRFDAAVAEYQRLTGVSAERPDLQLLEGGRPGDPGVAGASVPPDGGA